MTLQELDTHGGLLMRALVSRVAGIQLWMCWPDSDIFLHVSLDGLLCQ